MHFGENQLSPCSFGISPLPTAHPNLLQQVPVQPFTPCYGRCSLAMGGSHGFRSTRSDTTRSSHSVSLGLRLSTALATPLRVTRRVILQKARDHRGTRKCPTALTAWTRTVSGTLSLPSPGYFSPFPHGTVHYRSRPVCSLGPWSARIPTRFLVSRGTRETSPVHKHTRYRTVTC